MIVGSSTPTTWTSCGVVPPAVTETGSATTRSRVPAGSVWLDAAAVSSEENRPAPSDDTDALPGTTRLVGSTPVSPMPDVRTSSVDTSEVPTASER